MANLFQAPKIEKFRCFIDFTVVSIQKYISNYCTELGLRSFRAFLASSDNLPYGHLQ